MKTVTKLVLVTAALLLAATSAAQNDPRDDTDQLKIAAVEALMHAPPDRALPLVRKVLAGNHSNEIKERALFILSQVDDPAAQATLLDFANDSSGELQLEAIRMIGIGGDEDALSKLNSIYESGDVEAREAILEAFMIAGDKASVFAIAVNAQGDEFDNAVDMLGVMGARDELRELRNRTGASEALIHAYAVSGDFEPLRELALDGSDVELQVEAIHAMGIVGGEQVEATLVEIYRGAESEDIREAALDGLLISGYDAGVLELYRSSQDATEKMELLQRLVMMGSDEVWNIIDSTLDGGQ